ncbi:hypothetical protein K493DRAFT_291781, partial [Basidiobolus meristosporus CBS 931.73]
MHLPIVDHSVGVSFMDPMDCDYPAYIVQSISDEIVNLAVEIDPCVLLRQMGKWRDIDQGLIESICGELASSVKHTEHAYRTRKPIPSWNSSSIAWEQSIVEGHATHP